jgi:predicted amidohydrolase
MAVAAWAAHPSELRMGNDLRVGIVQAATVWRDAAANRGLYGDLVRPLAGRCDLIVLPETFTSGFGGTETSEPEDMGGPTVAWMAALSREVGAVVTGSIAIREGGHRYNRLLWMRPDGSHAHYDKRHLFRYAGEHERYSAGRERLVVEVRGWRVCPLVCYDLRFPVYSRNRVRDGAFDYDLVLYVANWPAPRHLAWRTLLRARAIENLACAVGVNRTGIDGERLEYLGGSAVVTPDGEAVVELDGQPQVATCTLSRAALDAHRARYPFHLDADRFELVEPVG